MPAYFRSEPQDTSLVITVNGVAVDGVEGQSIAGVLLSQGYSSWRAGPDGSSRGVFCGIGVCFDCLVTVNGLRDVRACRRPAGDGDTIETQSRHEESS